MPLALPHQPALERRRGCQIKNTRIYNPVAAVQLASPAARSSTSGTSSKMQLDPSGMYTASLLLMSAFISFVNGCPSLASSALRLRAFGGFLQTQKERQRVRAKRDPVRTRRLRTCSNSTYPPSRGTQPRTSTGAARLRRARPPCRRCCEGRVSKTAARASRSGNEPSGRDFVHDADGRGVQRDPSLLEDDAKRARHNQRHQHRGRPCGKLLDRRLATFQA